MSKQTTQDFSARVIVLFVSSGLISGVLTVWMSQLAFLGWLFWPGTGLVFWGCLMLACAVGRNIGWIRLEAPLNRRLISALIVAGTFPLAFLTMLAVTFLYSELYRVLFSVQWQRRATSPANEGILIGLIIAGVFSAVSVSLALRLLVQRWISRGFWLMLFGGIFTVLISIATSKLFGKLYGHPVGWDSMLLIVGETLFGGVCGYWLLRASFGYEQELLSAETVSEPYEAA
jgi:hypothetical protein